MMAVSSRTALKKSCITDTLNHTQKSRMPGFALKSLIMLAVVAAAFALVYFKPARKYLGNIQNAISVRVKSVRHPTLRAYNQSPQECEGKDISISPGMAVTAEIKTGKRRVIEFFISPFIKYVDESLTLR